MPKCLRERRYSTREQAPVSWRTSSHVMCFVVERYCGCRASTLCLHSKPKYNTIPVSRTGDTVNRCPILTLGLGGAGRRFTLVSADMDSPRTNHDRAA